MSDKQKDIIDNLKNSSSEEWIESVLYILKINAAELARRLCLSQPAISRWKERGVPKKYMTLLTAMLKDKNKQEKLLYIPKKSEILYVSKMDAAEIAALSGANTPAIRAQKIGSSSNYNTRVVLASLRANGISTVEEVASFVAAVSKKITEYRKNRKKYPILLTAVPDDNSIRYVSAMQQVEICEILGITKNSLAVQKYKNKKKYKERMLYLQLSFNGIPTIKELECAFEFLG